MVTTIEVDENTLLLLKKLKERMNVTSYKEAIKKLAVKELRPQKSMAGAFKNLSLKEVLKELKDERRKSDRF